MVVRVESVAKSFGPTEALRSCSLELRAGEVHVLMGENGSGKSTLVKILSGVHRPDVGSLVIAGRPVGYLASPRAAVGAGIATVFQEILVASHQSVLANVWLGRDALLRRGRPSNDRGARAAQAIGRLISVPPLDTPIGELSLNDRQAICIARALLTEPRVLILDEATSALDVNTRDNLFAIVGEMRERGVAVLLISHRMDEVEQIGDRLTVMRSGEVVGSAMRGQISTDGLLALMTGGGEEARQSAERADRARAPVALRAVGVRLHERAAPIDAEFHGGEIVGLAGLEGHGQDEFLQVLAGRRGHGGRVVLDVGGRERSLGSRSTALRAGVAYVPRDRREESLLPTRSILDNFGIATTRRDRRAGLVRRAAMALRFEHYAELLRITAGRHANPITSLSGGNQQKVIIARWLATRPRVLLLNDPTRGVDMGAKRDIYRILVGAAADGALIVMLSTELVELVDLTDRVLVFREGELSRQLSREDLSGARLVASYFGRESA